MTSSHTQFQQRVVSWPQNLVDNIPENRSFINVL